MNEFDWQLLSKVMWLIFIVGWGILRYRPNRRARKTKIEKTSRTLKERFSMAISFTGLGILPGIWVIGGLFGGSLFGVFDYSANPAVIIIGAFMIMAALRLFRLTHKALGAMWSHSLDLREGHKLVTQGIYKNVRHPMYSAFWLWALAQAFLIPNWFVGFAGLVGFGTLYFLRIGQEEAMMMEEFGDEYLHYCQRTKQIIPGIY
ncbi:MAG: isoprenylcysteine carboxylmethyltransferase family protein [Rhizobiaceae bacterium]|nr:isoprenylcysteine carboxylmethyltransferase family protein [Rhizobiaceae bacterium]